MKREVVFYKTYFRDFFEKLDNKTKLKIIKILDIVEILDRLPEQYFKYLKNTTGLYEIRIKLGSNIYRILCFFDEGILVVLLNGFQKKTQKTPKKEIELSERLKKEYYHEKE